MTGAKGVLLVAGRELRERGRSKAYIISTIVTLIILAGAIVIPSLIGGDETTYEVGVVGDGGRSIIDTASELARQRAGDDPADEFVVTEFATPDEAETAMEDGEVEAVVIDGSELLVKNPGGFGGS